MQKFRNTFAPGMFDRTLLSKMKETRCRVALVLADLNDSVEVAYPHMLCTRTCAYTCHCTCPHTCVLRSGRVTHAQMSTHMPTHMFMHTHTEVYKHVYKHCCAYKHGCKVAKSATSEGMIRGWAWLGTDWIGDDTSQSFAGSALLAFAFRLSVSAGDLDQR